MLENYKKEKEELLNKYQNLLSSENLFPIQIDVTSKSITKEDVIQKKKQLEDEIFYISITGEIKAGKSTLINSLIFGDKILPDDDTPHTAKITLLKYSETPQIKVYFYSKDEFQEVKKSLFQDEETKLKFEKDLENSIIQGISEINVIDEQVIIKEDKIENLNDYVAKAGKYTPFVNFVEVYYPSDILKNVIVVDTPGINDPNPIRDRVAKDWIKKTNANIYILKAQRTFTETDFEFIDKFLFSIPKELKLLVVNRIDEIENIENIKNYINSLASREEYKKREIIPNPQEVVYVSSLGALIDTKLKNGDELDDELDEYCELLYNPDDSKNFIKNHNLSQLKKQVEDKLIENKGNRIVQTHKKFIDSLFDTKIKFLKTNIKKEKSSLSEVSKTKEEIIEAIETTKHINILINEKLEIMNKKIQKEVSEQTQNSRKNIAIILNNFKRELEQTITLLNKNDISYITNLGWDIKNKIEEEIFSEVKNLIEDILNNTEDLLEIEKENLKDEIKQINKNTIDFEFAYEILEIDPYQYIKGEQVFENFNIEKMENLLSDARLINFKSFKYMTNSALNDLKSKLKFFLNELNEMLKNQIINFMNQNIQLQIKSFQDKITSSLLPIIHNKQKELEELKQNILNKDEIIEKHKNQILLLKKQIDETLKLKGKMNG